MIEYPHSAGPIFVLACSPRSGSTYVARLLTSTGGVLVWGEGRLLEQLADIKANRRFTTATPVAYDLHDFRVKRHNCWTVHLLPFVEDFEREWCLMLDRMFGRAAAAEGFTRWGMKETYWLEDAAPTIRRNWSNYRIVFLVRRFEPAFRSAVGTGWYPGETIEEFAKLWIRQASWVAARDERVCERLVTYDDVCQLPAELCGWCGLPPPASDLIQLAGTAGGEPSLEQRRLVEPLLPRIDAIERQLFND